MCPVGRRELGVGIESALSLLGRLLLSALRFLCHLNPPFRPWCGWRASHRTTRRTLPPGTLARVVGDLASSRGGLAVIATARSISSDKKNGVLYRAPLEALRGKLPLLRGLFLPALGSLLRHCFLLRICGSTSDGARGRHNGWAEPSTLIPDVDYG